MKTKHHFLMVSILALMATSLCAQNLEVSGFGSFGISNKILKPTGADMFGRLDYEKAKTLPAYSTGLLLVKPIKVKGIHFLLGTGAQFLNHNYYLAILDPKHRYQMETVCFSDNYVSIPFTLGIRKKINDFIIVDLSYSVSHDIPLIKSNTQEAHIQKVFNFIDLDYELNQDTKSGASTWITLSSKTMLKKGLYLDVALRYNKRYNHNARYNYNYTANYFIIDQSANTVIPNGSYGVSGLNTEILTDNFYSFSLGLMKVLRTEKKDTTN